MRTAKIWLNKGVMAISLYQDDLEVSYCPISHHPHPLEYIEGWIKFGAR